MEVLNVEALKITLQLDDFLVMHFSEQRRSAVDLYRLKYFRVHGVTMQGTLPLLQPNHSMHCSVRP